MDGNNTNLLREYGSEVVSAFAPSNIFYSIILIAGILGNAFVLYIYRTKMRDDERESRFFIPVLALYDFMVCIVTEIRFLTDTYWNVSFHSEKACKILVLFVVLTTMTSNTFLLAIAVQRYIKICRPLGKQMTLFWRRLTVALVVGGNIFFSIPTPIVAGIRDLNIVYRDVNITGKACATGDRQYPLFQLVYFSIMILVVVVNLTATMALYAPIACVIYRRYQRKVQKVTGITLSNAQGSNCSLDASKADETNTEGSHNKATDTGDKSDKEKQKRTPKTNFNTMFFVICFIYVLAYVPTSTMLVYDSVYGNFWTSISFAEIGAYSFPARTFVFNHAANPYIYAYFDLTFRSHLRNLVHRTG